MQGIAAASLPAGLRVYAIGDVHGRYDLLRDLCGRISADLGTRPPERSVEIFLGDYIDRGPASRDVLEWLVAAPPVCDRRQCLLGNHEAMLLAAVDHTRAMYPWLLNGGIDTLSAYGVATTDDFEAVRRAFRSALPSTHLAFLRALPRIAVVGRCIFVHAGLRPGLLLEQQDPDDLVWIRDPFLTSTADHGGLVVHGHTPVEHPDVRPNRVNIDTGAVFSGRLTCLVLEGQDLRFLQTGNA